MNIKLTKKLQHLLSNGPVIKKKGIKESIKNWNDIKKKFFIGGIKDHKNLYIRINLYNIRILFELKSNIENKFYI